MISIVAAQSENGVIGLGNDLPWYLQADLRHFKEITTGHPVVMGRLTYDSIVARLGKPLPNRENIVISRNSDFSAPGCIVCSSVEEALALHPAEEVFVIGGASIFEATLPNVDRIYLTLVKAHIEGDTFFPQLPSSEWVITSSEEHEADEKNQYPYEFQTLEPIALQHSNRRP